MCRRVGDRRDCACPCAAADAYSVLTDALWTVQRRRREFVLPYDEYYGTWANDLAWQPTT
jgi:hypothetical protein